MNIDLKDAVRTIETRMRAAARSEIDRRLRDAEDKIKRDVKSLTRDLLAFQPEILSLKNGRLRADFGIPKDEDPTATIIEAIAESTEVELKMSSSGKSAWVGGLIIYIQPKNFANLLSLAGVTVTTKKGTTIPWLDWLLTAGDRILVTEYHVEYKSGTGRSGRGHMKENDTFRVNPSFSGTSDNNFISRAFEGKENELKDIIRNHIG
jgi:hypothetical protein